MPTPDCNPSNASRRRSPAALWKRLLVLAVTLVLLLAAGEIGLRLLGQPPLAKTTLQRTVEPGGRLFQPHPELGYTNLPGRYLVTLPTGYSFTVTNNDDGLRITHPPRPADGTAQRPEIWIFGGSFSYGWSVNDEDTYACRLQEMLPEKEVVNFSVNGYGTLEALLQLQEAAATRGPSDAAVLAYIGFHDRRNILSRARCKNLTRATHKIPGKIMAHFDEQGELQIGLGEVRYTPPPLCGHSALVNLLDNAYNYFEEIRHRSRDVARELVRRFAATCDEHGIPAVVAALSDDPDTMAMLRWCEEQGIRTLDMSIDRSDEANLNVPHDFHPGPRGHEIYARKLHAYLTKDEDAH